VRAIPSAGTGTRAWTTPRKAAVSPLQPYTSKEEAQSATPESWVGYAANSGIIRPTIKSNAVNPSAWTTCRALAVPRAKAVSVTRAVSPVLLPAGACYSIPTATMSMP
jgi:hypothetical protein